ncbi:BREX-1 system phosphatase PglZ type A [Lacticaseibacillus hegangensis]|uniref:BREX-1 system phosphatase PglZ type A n=1 Tax=Lacticaseibacillus hegangensis TaxID=2486010 RepID=A0ABW4D0I7_9LACO|nr:BREX-1 system phosphatase PglZ type A [Lacticaseibacillus hegangensis]
MADLNLDQVTEALKGMFTPSNHFVFWYDDQASFSDNIDDLQQRLDQPIIRMAPDEQFKTKLKLLELQKSGESALVYSPAPMPELKLNFLADFIRFSKTYTADATLMLINELGLPSEQKAWLESHAQFFGSRERKEKFQRLYRPGIDPGMTVLAVLSKADEVRLNAVLRAVLHNGSLDDDNAILQLFAKYGLLETFWSFVVQAYGYTKTKPTLRGLMTAILLNFAFDEAQLDLPTSFADYQLGMVNNAISFVQNSRNMIDVKADLFRIATDVWQFVHAESQFKRLDISQLIKIDAFPQIDIMIVQWMTARLLDDDIAVRVGDMTLKEAINLRGKMAYHEKYDRLYQIELAAVTLLGFHVKGNAENLDDMIDDYTSHDYRIDTTYREFVVSLMNVDPDQIELVEGLRSKVENSYLNDYLAHSVSSWNQVYSPQAIVPSHQQRRFYSNFVTSEQQRTVVIISDAFRFEAAKELQAKLDRQDKFETKMDWMVTGLPSVTYFGMAALLPNHHLAYHGEKNVTVDGQNVDNVDKRREVLQAENPASQAIQVSKFLNMNTEERKALLTGQQIVYLYHNEIDVTGESAKTESSVFKAVDHTIDTLSRTIEYLRNLSVSNILVTADHGFIYRWAPIDEANKTDISNFETDKKEQRYAFSQRPIELTGVGYQRLGDLLGNDDPTYVNYPTNFNIFRAPGASQNYVHGGASAQEMLVPVVNIKLRKGRSQAVSAKIHDVTSSRRITSRQMTVRVMQDEAISDVNTLAHYSIYFADDQHRKISGVTPFVADIANQDPTARIKNIRLTLTEQTFENGQTYHLILHNDETDVEYSSDYQMDIVIQGGFGFDI